MCLRLLGDRRLCRGCTEGQLMDPAAECIVHVPLSARMGDFCLTWQKRDGQWEVQEQGWEYVVTTYCVATLIMVVWGGSAIYLWGYLSLGVMHWVEMSAGGMLLMAAIYKTRRRRCIKVNVDHGQVSIATARMGRRTLVEHASLSECIVSLHPYGEAPLADPRWVVMFTSPKQWMVLAEVATEQEAQGYLDQAPAWLQERSVGRGCLWSVRRRLIGTVLAWY